MRSAEVVHTPRISTVTVPDCVRVGAWAAMFIIITPRISRMPQLQQQYNHGVLVEPLWSVSRRRLRGFRLWPSTQQLPRPLPFSSTSARSRYINNWQHLGGRWPGPRSLQMSSNYGERGTGTTMLSRLRRQGTRHPRTRQMCRNTPAPNERVSERPTPSRTTLCGRESTRRGCGTPAWRLTAETGSQSSWPSGNVTSVINGTGYRRRPATNRVQSPLLWPASTTADTAGRRRRPAGGRAGGPAKMKDAATPATAATALDEAAALAVFGVDVSKNTCGRLAATLPLVDRSADEPRGRAAAPHGRPWPCSSRRL